MTKFSLSLCLIVMLALGGCSGENDSVSASDAQDIMKKVEGGVEDAAEDAAARLQDALE